MSGSRRVLGDERELRIDAGRSVAVRWVRDPRARRLRLTVSERGVRLTLPWRASERLAQQFLHQHHGWLIARLAELPDTDATPPLQPGNTAQLPLWGVERAVQWEPGRFARVVPLAPEQASDAALRFSLPAAPRPGAAAAALRECYLAAGRAEIGRHLPALLPGLPRAPSRFRLQPLQSLWGSLSARGVVSLDLALVLAPPALFRYVLVHELCHLIQPNHSPAFWAEVATRCADWRDQRAWLREHGLPLKARLRALLAG